MPGLGSAQWPSTRFQRQVGVRVPRGAVQVREQQPVIDPAKIQIAKPAWDHFRRDQRLGQQMLHAAELVAGRAHDA
jgi:hypothetical protein